MGGRNFVEPTGQELVEKVQYLTQFIDNDDYNVWIKVGGCIRDQLGDGGFAVWDDWSRSSSKYRANEMQMKWRGVYRPPNSMNALVGMAKKHPGFKPWRSGAWDGKRIEVEVRPVDREAEMARTRKHNEIIAQLAEAELAESLPGVRRFPYLAQKKIDAYGIRYRAGKLLIPIRDIKGKLWNVQKISDTGDKAYAALPRVSKGQPAVDEEGYQIVGRKTGCFYHIGTINEKTKVALFCEGFSTAASLYYCTGIPTVMCIDSGNLYPVAKAFHEKYPGLRQVFCADNDTHLEAPVEMSADGRNRKKPGRNAGVYYATKAAEELGGTVAIPEFAEKYRKDSKDFNDLYLQEGKEAVRKVVSDAIQSAWGPPPQPEPKKVAHLCL